VCFPDKRNTRWSRLGRVDFDHAIVDRDAITRDPPGDPAAAVQTHDGGLVGRFVGECLGR
jgi:hypothetical protein